MWLFYSWKTSEHTSNHNKAKYILCASSLTLTSFIFTALLLMTSRRRYLSYALWKQCQHGCTRWIICQRVIQWKEMRASEGCAMIDVPDTMICMKERRPEIEIIDDGLSCDWLTCHEFSPVFFISIDDQSFSDFLFYLYSRLLHIRVINLSSIIWYLVIICNYLRILLLYLIYFITNWDAVWTILL